MDWQNLGAQSNSQSVIANAALTRATRRAQWLFYLPATASPQQWLNFLQNLKSKIQYGISLYKVK